MAEGQRRDWTRSENEIVVEAYLRMLTAELRGDAFVKTQVNADVQRLIGRSKGSIEYKFQNVSAVLIDQRHPFVNGYKPASNYQDALVDLVLEGIGRHPELDRAALASMTAAVDLTQPIPTLRLVPPPAIESHQRQASRLAVKRDYVLLEHSNTALGLAGELAVVDWERRSLVDAGRADLAQRVEHVSQLRGDGLGYDVRSFSPDGEDRFIEVKTTRKSAYWPMLISRNEVDFSRENGNAFSLYRVFEFGKPTPGLFRLPGKIIDTCSLDPTTYEALPVTLTA